MGQFEKKIFKGKSFGNLLNEIYDNQKKKEEQINSLISQLKPLIQEIGDATLLVPLIKEYMDLGIKNDDILVKMVALVQRSLNSTSTEGGLGISDSEREELLADVRKLNKDKE